MAKRIGKLHALVTANTERFQQGMRRAKQSTTSFGAGITGLAGKILKLGGALTGIGGIAATGLLIRGQMKSLDVVAKTSDRIGVQTERLIGLQFAMEQSGGTAEDMTKALERIAVATTEVTQGTGEALRAFEGLRLDATKLIALPLDEQLIQVAEAVEKIPTATERMGLLADIFGRRQLKVINLLLQGRSAIEGMVSEAKDLGFAFNRIDLGMVEQANDAINRARRSFQGIFGKVTIAIAPVLESAADKLSKLFAKVGDIRPWLQAFLRSAAEIVGDLVDVFRIDIPGSILFGGKDVSGIERLGVKLPQIIDDIFKGAEDRSRRRTKQFNLLGLLGEPAQVAAATAGGGSLSIGLATARQLGIAAGAPMAVAGGRNPLVTKAESIDEKVGAVVRLLSQIARLPGGLL